MRRNFFDIINDSEINVRAEIARIDHFFTQRENYGPSLKSFIDKTCFREWKYNKRCLSIDDLVITHKIRTGNKVSSIEEMFIYFEFLANIILFLDKKISSYSEGWDRDVIGHIQKMSSEIVENIASVLDELNYKFIKLEEDKSVIVEKSEIVSAVSEIYEEISPKVIEYKRFNLAGNLERKKELLLGLAHKYESVNKKLIKNGHENLATNVRCLLNNLNIRHNPKEGSKEDIYLKKLSTKELENWYDKTYDTILLALMSAHYVDYKGEIDKLKNELAN